LVLLSGTFETIKLKYQRLNTKVTTTASCRVEEVLNATGAGKFKVQSIQFRLFSEKASQPCVPQDAL
jgi:adenine C2-methylase RlmN of 23S rRNA A2503 and tRNA A37